MRYREVEFEQGSKAWLDWRNAGIGGSDIIKIVKGSRAELEQLAYNKIHDVSFTFSETTEKAMKRGHDLEPVARDLISKVSGINFEPKCLELISNPFIRVSLDGISNNGKTLIEIKCLGAKTHDQVAKTKEIPQGYYYQIQFQLLVTGARRALYVGYNPDSTVKTLDIHKVEVDWEVQGEIWKAIESFEKLYKRFKSVPDIILVCGFARQGKDTVVNYLCEQFGYSRVAFADELKREAVELGILPEGFTEEQKNEKRPELVALGREKREIDPDYWLKRGLAQIKKPIGFDKNGDVSYFSYRTSISDGRYINEVFGAEDYSAESNLSCLSWWVERDGVPANEEEENKTAIVKTLCDEVLYNKGSKEDLYNEITRRLMTYGE